MRCLSPRSSLVRVAFHASAFPEQVRRDLLESLRKREVNHKFHYDSVKQTQKWLALHQAYSPSRTDPDCAAVYDRGFKAAVARIASKRVNLIGLGPGGGQKDARLIKLLRGAGKTITYIPLDVSGAMALTAAKAAMAVIPAEQCLPVVCDLGSAEDWTHALAALPPGPRLITFFGMLPNFEPNLNLPRLAKLVRADDYLLLSANLAPDSDYAAGLQKILPLYENELTRDWLMAFLTDLGVERADGSIQFAVEGIPMRSKRKNALKRIAAHFEFARARSIIVYGKKFSFHSGESIRLFFSYRHTTALLRELIAPYGLQVMDQWITRSEEEGVFLIRADRRRHL